jgi:hypothetical protein
MINTGKKGDKRRVVDEFGIVVEVCGGKEGGDIKRAIPMVKMVWLAWGGVLVRSIHTLNFYKNAFSSPRLERLVRIFNEMYPDQAKMQDMEWVKKEQAHQLYRGYEKS